SLLERRRPRRGGSTHESRAAGTRRLAAEHRSQGPRTGPPPNLRDTYDRGVEGGEENISLFVPVIGHRPPGNRRTTSLTPSFHGIVRRARWRNPPQDTQDSGVFGPQRTSSSDSETRPELPGRGTSRP